jgi:cell fate regulator YaaT (PSP1 superfamily)
MKKNLGVAAILGLVLLLIPLTGCAQSPSDVVKAFSKGIAENNIQKILDNSTDKAGRLYIVFLDKVKDSMKDVKVVKEEIDGDTAKVTVKYLQDNKEKEDKLDLVKVDGKWKVDIKK